MTSHPRVVVGIDGTPRGEDAVAFAAVLARMVGTGLLLAYIYGPRRHSPTHMRCWPRADIIVVGESPSRPRIDDAREHR